MAARPGWLELVAIVSTVVVFSILFLTAIGTGFLGSAAVVLTSKGGHEGASGASSGSIGSGPMETAPYFERSVPSGIPNSKNLAHDGASSDPSAVELPYGVSLLYEMATFASVVPALNFTGYPGSDSACSAVANDTSRGQPMPLTTASPATPLCLNGVSGGVVNTTWQANLSSYVDYRNGTSTIIGCPPTANSSSCPFFASNRYTEYVPIWNNTAPTNSSTFWSPDETGFDPDDLVFVIGLGFNASLPPDLPYQVTVSIGGVTPVPQTFYVETPGVSGTANANLTIIFDMTASWTTSNETDGPTPEIGEISLVVGYPQPCSLCVVSFSETGMAPGTSWSATLGSTTVTEVAPDPILFAVPNGTYPYSLEFTSSYRANNSTGSVTVNGMAESESVTFRLMTYGVTFTESGLPGGTEWWVNGTTGASNSSTTTTLSFNDANGTYDYAVATVDKDYASPGGAFTVNGKGISENATFSLVTYTVKFTESGLPSGTEWWVNMTGGASTSSTTTTLSIREPNGTNPVTIATGASYLVASSSIMVTVSGSPVMESLTFARAYEVTFDRPSGAPAGTSWTVYVNTTAPDGALGVTLAAPLSEIVRTTTTSTLNILLSNGTYSYSIWVAGYPSLATQGSATVNGSPFVQNPPAASSPFLGFSGATGYYVLGATIAAVLVVLGAAVFLMRRRPPPAVATHPSPKGPTSPEQSGAPHD
jgi:hypothetical protein